MNKKTVDKLFNFLMENPDYLNFLEISKNGEDKGQWTHIYKFLENEKIKIDDFGNIAIWINKIKKENKKELTEKQLKTELLRQMREKGNKF